MYSPGGQNDNAAQLAISGSYSSLHLAFETNHCCVKTKLRFVADLLHKNLQQIEVMEFGQTHWYVSFLCYKSRWYSHNWPEVSWPYDLDLLIVLSVRVVFRGAKITTNFENSLTLRFISYGAPCPWAAWDLVTFWLQICAISCSWATHRFGLFRAPQSP